MTYGFITNGLNVFFFFLSKVWVFGLFKTTFWHR